MNELMNACMHEVLKYDFESEHDHEYEYVYENAYVYIYIYIYIYGTPSPRQSPHLCLLIRHDLSTNGWQSPLLMSIPKFTKFLPLAFQNEQECQLPAFARPGVGVE